MKLVVKHGVRVESERNKNGVAKISDNFKGEKEKILEENNKVRKGQTQRKLLVEEEEAEDWWRVYFGQLLSENEIRVIGNE